MSYLWFYKVVREQLQLLGAPASSKCGSEKWQDWKKQFREWKNTPRKISDTNEKKQKTLWPLLLNELF